VPRKRKIKLKCPICKKPVESTAGDFPFCSERCKLVDLGKWASGQYVVSEPLQDTDEIADIRNFPASEDED
jgi:endogenous inhibitor of DNA gyrase (YacG/DUF329 family)